MTNTERINAMLAVLATRPFREKFHIRGTEAAMVRQRGIVTILEHAADLIRKRLAPAAPLHDGKQTPYKGHPVFVAQHATATCCRTCLERWHHIAKGRTLTNAEQQYVVAILEAWIVRDLELHAL